jgi:hypothetical protein
VHLFPRRSVQTVLLAGGLATIVLELAGAAAAVVMTFVALLPSPVASRRLRWSASPGASLLTQVPTQRTATLGS